MTDRTDSQTEGNESGSESTGEESSAGRDFKWADEEVPERLPRASGDGRYDLSWDGVSGGCATDES